MKRSRVRNQFQSNTRSDLDQKPYNKQRNYGVSLFRKGEKFLQFLTLTF